MDFVSDLPEDGPLPGVIVYDNNMDDSSTTTPSIFYANVYIVNTDSYLLIPYDTQLESDSVQDWVHQMQLMFSQ